MVESGDMLSKLRFNYNVIIIFNIVYHKQKVMKIFTFLVFTAKFSDIQNSIIVRTQ